jgi:LysM repeat protein
LKLPASVKDKFLATYNHAAYPRKVTFAGYKVRSGETIGLIARRYGIKVDPLTDLNGVSARSPLRKGIRVLLPMPDDTSRSLSSLDVRDPPESPRHSRRHRHHAKPYKISYKRRESAKSHKS